MTTCMMRGIIILALLCIGSLSFALNEGELFYVVQYRKSSPVDISTLKSTHSNLTKKAKSKHVIVEHFFKTNFDLLDRPKQPSSTVRLKLTLNREILSAEIFDDNSSLPAENCFYHGTVQKYSLPSISLSTCGDFPGLHGLLVRKNDTLWITPERMPDLLETAMMDDAKYSFDHTDDEADMDHEAHITPLPHRVRLYEALNDGIDKCATTASFNFHGFDADSRVSSSGNPSTDASIARASENLREHRLALAVRLDSDLIDGYFNGDAKLATNNILSALNIADLVTQRFGLGLVVSSLRLWTFENTTLKTGNVTSSAPSHSRFSLTNPRMNLHRLILHNKNRLRQMVQQELSHDSTYPTSGSGELTSPSPSVLVVFSGVALNNNKNVSNENPTISVPLDASVPFSICSAEMHRAVIFVSVSTPPRNSSPMLLAMASSFLHQLAHALGFKPNNDDESSSTKCPSCSHAWQCLGSAGHGDVRSIIAPLLGCQYGSDSLHGFSNLACLLPTATTTTVQKALLGEGAISSVENRDWLSFSMGDGRSTHRSNSPANGGGGGGSSNKKNYCGDGIVGESEECDCHVVANNARPSQSKAVYPKSSTCVFRSCCDPSNCLLVPWAQCSPSLASECCTENCTLRPATAICRPSKSPCQVPSFCGSTLNGRCPVDRFIANGFSCLPSTSPDSNMLVVPNYGSDKEFANGVCFAGKCRSRDVACQQLWGPSAKSAHNKCYDPTCDGECDGDIFCDNLQCQVSSSAVHVPAHTNLTFVVSKLHGSGELENAIECRHLVHSGKKMATDKQQFVGSVPEWAPCGQGRVCLQKQCVDIKTTKGVALCPGTAAAESDVIIPCSGNGFCTLEEHQLSSYSIGKCVCKPFFTGLACEFHLNAPGVWPDDGYAYNVTTSAGVSFLGGFGAWLTERLLLTAVVPFIGIILVAFSFFVICYRRKLIMIRPSKRKRKSSSLRRQNNSSSKARPPVYKVNEYQHDDGDIQSPVLLCTTTNAVAPCDETIGAGEEVNDNDLIIDQDKCLMVDGDVPQQHPAAHLSRQPERGILKKRVHVPEAQQPNTASLCRVDEAAAMAAMMKGLDSNNSEEGNDSSDGDEATAALRHLSQQFGGQAGSSLQQQPKTDQKNVHTSSSLSPDEGDEDENDNNNGEEGGMLAEDGSDELPHLASLRQIVALRRSNNNNNYSLQTPPAPSMHNNGVCYDGGNKNNAASMRPDVISACINPHSLSAVNAGVTGSKCNCQLVDGCADCSDDACNKKCGEEESVAVLQTPLEQLLNHIEQKFSTSSLVTSAAATLMAGSNITPGGSHRPAILFTTSLLQQAHDNAALMESLRDHNNNPFLLTSSSSLARRQQQQQQQMAAFTNNNNDNVNNITNNDNVLTASTSLSSAILGLSPSMESNEVSIAAPITHTDC